MLRHDRLHRVICAAFVLQLAIGASAQAPAPLKFDVSSVKPTPRERHNRLRTDYCRSGSRFAVAGAPLIWSVAYAFRLKEFQIAGAPDWLNRFDEAYDIEAVAPAPADEEQCRRMVQSLLADRFKMKTHRESRKSRVYLLTIAKNGPKLRRGGQVRLNGGVQLNAAGKPDWPDGLTLSELASILSNYTDTLVLDRTRLEGRYGIVLDFSIRNGDDRVSIFTAVQEQLGLKLEAGTAPIDMLIIDHIERPNEN